MDIVVPGILAVIAVVGLLKRVELFEAFTDGARDGLKTLYTIAPTMIGLIVAVGMLRASGFMELLCDALRPLCDAVGFPAELLSMALLRPVSGSGATALLTSLYEDMGPDSFAGRCASVLAGSTETTFYAVTMYYGAVGVKKIRHTLASALLADLTAVIFSVVTVRIMFGGS